MWHLHRIPKIMHCYFGATKMSWLRYMTVKSFSLTNPDWKIKFYTPKQTFSQGLQWEQHIAPKTGDNTKDWHSEIKNIPNTEVVEVDCIQEGWGDIPDVFRADLIRLKVLGNEGGLWQDADIINFRPLNEAYFNSLSNIELNTIVSYTHLHHHFSIGYFFSGPNNPFFQTLYSIGMQRLLSKGDRQTFGVILWNSLVKDDNDIKRMYPGLKVLNIDLTICYPFLYNNMSAILMEPHFLRNTHPQCLAIHWYGGHPMSAEWEHRLTPENYMNYNTTLCNSIKEAFKYDK